MIINTDELDKYTYLGNDELSEVGELLATLTMKADYVSEEFYKALEAEINAQVKNYKENSVITDHEETKTITHKFQSLDWIDHPHF